MNLRRVNSISRAWLAPVLISLLLAGCTALPGMPTTAPASGVSNLSTTTPVASLTPSPTLPPSPTPEPTQVVPTPEPAGPTPVPGRQSLVSLREEGLFIGDGWGAQSRQALSLGPVTGVALHGSQLAYVVDGGIFLADLNAGMSRRLADSPPAFLLGPDLIWTDDGRAILTVADHEDSSAAQVGRSLDIGVISLPDGAWRPGLALPDCAGVTILRADGASGQVLLVAWGAEPSFKEALRYDLANGQIVAKLPIAGAGEIVPSPGGRLALTSLFDEAQGVNTDLLYDLTGDSTPIRQRLALNPDTHTASHLWSLDGKRIAYLLRSGRTSSEDAGQGLGIWVWDIEQKKTAKLIDTSDPADGPVAWTPDGRYLIYRQADAAGGRAFYALDIAQNAARPLPLDASSRILGWLPAQP